MPGKDKRIDAYIAKSRPFARPIMKHLRDLVHKACPAVEETMKWSFPHFDYKGEMMCSMAAFKLHCAFGFWKASLMKDKRLTANAKSESSMGHLGRISSLEDLPADRVLIAYIKEAAALNDKGIKIKKAPAAKRKKELLVPDFFISALEKNTKAFAVFESFSYSNKKEYIKWITDAKTEETKARRMDTAIEWMSEGKIRNWKYVRKINNN